MWPTRNWARAGQKKGRKRGAKSGGAPHAGGVGAELGGLAVVVEGIEGHVQQLIRLA